MWVKFCSVMFKVFFFFNPTQMFTFVFKRTNLGKCQSNKCLLFFRASYEKSAKVAFAPQSGIHGKGNNSSTSNTLKVKYQTVTIILLILFIGEISNYNMMRMAIAMVSD